MINFTMKAAGQTVAVSAMFESTRDYCKQYICQETPGFAITILPEDIALERKKSAGNYSDAYLETIALQRKITEVLFDYDTLLFHGSLIAVDGVGYLFTAKSGTGKSTHTRLWRELLGDRAVMVNDDKPFLRITRGAVQAYGSPWNGKHGLGNHISVPLKAICLLARGKENQIQKIPAKEAVFMLLQQSSRPADLQRMPKYMELLDGLSESVEFYRMQCNMDPEVAKVAFEAMSQQ